MSMEEGLLEESGKETEQATPTASKPASLTTPGVTTSKPAAINSSGADTTTKIIAPDETHRVEVSATTIGRMLGLTTQSDLKLLEGKVDLLTTKLNNLNVRMEKIISMLSKTPTGSDLERIDVQLGALKAVLNTVAAELSGIDPSKKGDPKTAKNRIVSNNTHATQDE